MLLLNLNFPTEDFIEGYSAVRLAFRLHSTLSQPNEVSPNTDRADDNEGDCEDIVASMRSLASNEARAFETLHTKTVLQSDEIRDLVTQFSVFLDILHAYRSIGLLLQLGPVLVGEVESFFWRVGGVPGDREQAYHFFGKSETSAGVGRETNPRQVAFASVLGGEIEVIVIFSRIKGANLVGDVICGLY